MNKNFKLIFLNTQDTQSERDVNTTVEHIDLLEKVFTQQTEYKEWEKSSLLDTSQK